MSRLFIALALIAVAAPAAAKPVKAAKRPAATLPAVTRESCPDALPFPLPDERLTAEWCDMEWELWAASAWDAYCTGRADSHACRCADAFGGGPY